VRPILLAALLAAGLVQAEDLGPHLRNIRQLTFGGQNAEAYWSPDGRRLVFQSTRDPYQCDQIFVMNADGSGQRLVSTGKGRTTCAYFLKDGKHIVYASTHEKDEKCPTPPDRSKGYVWAVYPGYNLYVARNDGTIVRRLTNQDGYDAEATVNWASDRIVYTSMTGGDLELWEMRPDGSKRRRLTAMPGYDGGAFFSRDGRQLVWRATDRRNHEAMERYRELIRDNLTAPMKMEVVIAGGDGKNPKQITNFGCASFAPTFKPDGKRIIFASNKHDCDWRRFELYMMNTDGTDLRQLTDFGGFVSFPEFSPDGRKLVFSSDWKAKSRYEFNIFVADWAE
jgi:TolB protein